MTDPTTPGGVRRRLADARATVVGTSGLRTRVAKHTTALAKLREAADTLRTRVDRQDKRVAELEELVKELQRATTLDTSERERRDTQFGSLEVRLADLEQRLAVPSRSPDGAADAEALDAGRALLDEVRTEHSRIRVRMQVVSAYEERLRRVEESVAELYDGDTRHQV